MICAVGRFFFETGAARGKKARGQRLRRGMERDKGKRNEEEEPKQKARFDPLRIKTGIASDADAAARNAPLTADGFCRRFPFSSTECRAVSGSCGMGAGQTLRLRPDDRGEDPLGRGASEILFDFPQFIKGRGESQGFQYLTGRARARIL